MDFLYTLNKCRQILENRCAPDVISELDANEVYVFGAKPNGNHKSGAAKKALEYFGATQGQGEGLSGQSYAIPVHKYRTHKMDEAVKRFVGFAKKHPNLLFYVLPVGCGSAGMDINCVAEMFSSAINVDNIFLPSQFVATLMEHRKRNRIIEYTNYPDIYELRRMWQHKLSHLIGKISDSDSCIGKIEVKMDSSIGEAVELIIDMCQPLLIEFYPELKNKGLSVKDTFWIKPDMYDVSLAINQITEGWYQCIKYMLGYDWYCPSLTRQDIINCLTYHLRLYGPYFDEFDY